LEPLLDDGAGLGPHEPVAELAFVEEEEGRDA
jgi:hypothetical protein